MNHVNSLEALVQTNVNARRVYAHNIIMLVSLNEISMHNNTHLNPCALHLATLDCANKIVMQFEVASKHKWISRYDYFFRVVIIVAECSHGL